MVIILRDRNLTKSRHVIPEKMFSAGGRGSRGLPPCWIYRFPRTLLAGTSPDRPTEALENGCIEALWTAGPSLEAARALRVNHLFLSKPVPFLHPLDNDRQHRMLSASWSSRRRYHRALMLVYHEEVPLLDHDSCYSPGLKQC